MPTSGKHGRLSRQKCSAPVLAINQESLYAAAMSEAMADYEKIRDYNERQPPRHLIVQHLRDYLHPRLMQQYRRYLKLPAAQLRSRKVSIVAPAGDSRTPSPAPTRLLPRPQRHTIIPTISVTDTESVVDVTKSDAGSDPLRVNQRTESDPPVNQRTGFDPPPVNQRTGFDLPPVNQRTGFDRQPDPARSASGLDEVAEPAARGALAPPTRRTRRGSVDVGSLLRSVKPLTDPDELQKARGTAERRRSSITLGSARVSLHETLNRDLYALSLATPARLATPATSPGTDNTRTFFRELHEQRKQQTIEPNPIDAPWDRRRRSRASEIELRGSIFTDKSVPIHRRHEGMAFPLAYD